MYQTKLEKYGGNILEQAQVSAFSGFVAGKYVVSTLFCQSCYSPAVESAGRLT